MVVVPCRVVVKCPRIVGRWGEGKTGKGRSGRTAVQVQEGKAAEAATRFYPPVPQTTTHSNLVLPQQLN